MNFLLNLYPGDHSTLNFANVIVQVTMITSLAILFTRFPVRPSAATRSAICLCALGCVLLVPLMAYSLDVAGIAFVRLPLLATAAPVTEAKVSENTTREKAGPYVVAAAPQNNDFTDERSEVPLATPSRSVGPAPLYSSVDKWRAVVSGAMLVWIAGILVCAVRLLRGCLILKRLREDVRTVDDYGVAGVLEDVCRALGMHRLPRVVTSQRPVGPIVTDGFSGPMVILPKGLLRDLDDRQLRDVLTHECAHLVQRDILVGLLQRTAQIIFWPHVMVLYLNRELTGAREDLCDNFVLHRGDASGYARTLVELSQALPQTHVPIGACGMFNSVSQLETRIINLLNEGRNLMTRTKRLTLVSFGTVFLAVSAMMSGSTLLEADEAENGKTRRIGVTSPTVDREENSGQIPPAATLANPRHLLPAATLANPRHHDPFIEDSSATEDRKSKSGHLLPAATLANPRYHYPRNHRGNVEGRLNRVEDMLRELLPIVKKLAKNEQSLSDRQSKIPSTQQDERLPLLNTDETLLENAKSRPIGVTSLTEDRKSKSGQVPQVPASPTNTRYPAYRKGDVEGRLKHVEDVLRFLLTGEKSRK